MSLDDNEPIAFRDAGEQEPDREEDCPVIPLGARQDEFYFLMANGEFFALKAREFNANMIMCLFGGKDNWLWDKFPRLTGPADNPSQVGWSIGQARDWLMRQCVARGWFATDLVRGSGTWADGSDVIVHCGDEILTPTGWQRAGRTIGNYVYPVDRPQPRPADQQAGIEVGRQIEGALSSWNWHAPSLAPQLLMGWLYCAFVVGCLEWRPHVLLAGAKGTGKTSLEKLLKAVLDDRAVLALSASSEAAVRQSLGGAAKPVILDEVENEADSRSADRVFKLARLASSEGQSRVGRGSVRGEAMAWDVSAVFMFSAVLPPRALPQDVSRITTLELGPLVPSAEGMKAVRATTAEAAVAGPELRTRAISGLPTFRANLDVYVDALLEAGHDGRSADQLGSLLAGRDVLCENGITDAAAAAAMVAQLAPSGVLPDEDDSSDERQCLHFLLSSRVDYIPEDKRTRIQTGIGDLIQRFHRNREGDAGQALRSLGILIAAHPEPQHVGKTFIVIANHHAELAKLFRGEVWHSGRWTVSLKRLPGATTGPVRHFGGAAKGRGVWVPIEHALDSGYSEKTGDEPIDGLDE